MSFSFSLSSLYSSCYHNVWSVPQSEWCFIHKLHGQTSHLGHVNALECILGSRFSLKVNTIPSTTFSRLPTRSEPLDISILHSSSTWTRSSHVGTAIIDALTGSFSFLSLHPLYNLHPFAVRCPFSNRPGLWVTTARIAYTGRYLL